MLLTVKPHTDRTLQLDVGDHDFIRHPSAVAFGTARYAPADKLEAALSSGRATLHADMSPTLLARVGAGLLTSAHTPNEVADYCRAKFPP